jgi:ATP-dependent helicase STH1/SNF2
MTILRFYNNTLTPQQQILPQSVSANFLAGRPLNTQQLMSQGTPVPSVSSGVPVRPPVAGLPSQSGAFETPLLNEKQREALRYQIYAFKVLSSNQPLPDTLKKAVFDTTTTKGAVVIPGIQPPTPSTKVEPAKLPVQSPVPVNKGFDASKPLPQTSQPPQVNQAQLGIENSKKMIVPSIAPVGIDPIALALERERRIRSRVEYRTHLLSSLPSNLSNEPVLSGNGTPKIRALIELKALKLLDKQKRLREEVVRCMNRGTMLLTAVDRNLYKRMKKQSLREARQTEMIEQSQRSEREKRERQKMIDYCNNIISHGRELLAFHKSQQSKQSRLGGLVLKFHANAEKEEQRRAQRLQQERLNALKANDEEAYLKLIDQAKDTRITHILQKTTQYLSSLSSAVITQQENISAEGLVIDEGALKAAEEDSDNKDYYSVAHRIKEDVTEQSTLLVGGRLKDYQIKGLQWMISLYNNRLNGILADEMGLGKTIQTISLVTYLIEKKKQPGPFLIIIPLATMTNWVLEFDKWAPDVTKIVFKGGPAERKRLAAEVKQGNFNVLITTYEYIIKERPLLSKIKWIYMIIDEGHRMKNEKSKLSTTLMQYYQTRYRLILTGTPLQVSE